MKFVRYTGRLARRRFGLWEPQRGPRRAPRRLDAIVLPLLGFDSQGTRLGTGGGYYDRALARCRGVRPLRIGYAYALQQCERLPREAWDIPLHAVVTERGVQWPTG